MKLNKRQVWIVGTVAAFCGVGIARIVADQMPDDLQLVTFMAGIAMAFGGLLLIALGTERCTKLNLLDIVPPFSYILGTFHVIHAYHHRYFLRVRRHRARSGS